MDERTVSSVMTTKVISIRPEASYQDVVDTLTSNKISAVPVVDATGTVLGVVSELDAMAKPEFHGGTDDTPLLAGPGQRRRHRKALGTTAADLMTRPAVTIGPNEPVTRAARRMATEKVRRLFVVDDTGALVGVVSRRDVLTTYLRPDQEIDAEIRRNFASCRASWLSFPEVSLQVVDGTAVLTGVVALRSTTDLVHRLALAVPGVVAVRNELRFHVDDGLTVGL